MVKFWTSWNEKRKLSAKARGGVLAFIDEAGISEYHGGHGEVTAIAEGEDGPVISVRYENGRLQQFLSRGQSSRFMKIGE